MEATPRAEDAVLAQERTKLFNSLLAIVHRVGVGEEVAAPLLVNDRARTCGMMTEPES